MMRASARPVGALVALAWAAPLAPARAQTDTGTTSAST